jgi:RND family efflux transporter MFP subunit
MMKNKYKFFLGAIIVFLMACEESNISQDKKENYPVVCPVLKDTTVTEEYVADIHAIQNIEIRSRVKGFIEKIHVDEGEIVSKDQILFTISSHEFKQELLKKQAAHKSAIAEAKMAEVLVTNTKILVDKSIVSASELSMAEAKLEAAKAKIEEALSEISSARLKIAFATVKAPFSGVINRLPLKAGSLVDEGTLLTSISNDLEVFAYFNLSEIQYLNFLKQKENQTQVKLQIANGEVYPLLGVIETSESEIDQETGNLAFRARFKNPDRFLKHGATGKILREKHFNNAMLIPQKASFEVQDQTYVYIVDSVDSKVKTQSIRIRNRIPHFYIIEPDLKLTDRILYEGIQRVKEGDIVSTYKLNTNQLDVEPTKK